MNSEDNPMPTQQWTVTRIGIEIIGWIGATMLLVAYYLIQNKKVDNDSQVYIMLNVLGAFFLMINAWSHKAYPSTITNFIWLIIGSVSVYKIFYRSE
jgi:membrane-bound ClpP family serine protease